MFVSERLNLTIPSPDNYRFYAIGGLTIRVGAELPFTADTFLPKFKIFRVATPGPDLIQVTHHFSLPDLGWVDRSYPEYRQSPWEIHHQGPEWLYLGIGVDQYDPRINNAALFNEDHSRGDIFHLDDSAFQAGQLGMLTLIPTDQILLARVLACRQACYLHACGMVIRGHGLAFIGHSEAGKTTTARMLKDDGELLCDDRIILRRWPEGFRIHGTWSHGDIPEVSAGSAPLRAVFLIEQAPENRLIQLEPRQAIRTLPEFVVKPLVTRAWWENVLDMLGALVREVPVYRLRLDKSGAVRPLLHSFLDDLN